MKKELSDVIQKAKVALFKKWNDDEPTYVKEIGYEWAPFGAVEGDMARRVETDSNDYCILYKTPIGKFKPHFHINKESGVVINGKMILETPNSKKILPASSSYEILAKEWHSCEFLEETTLFLHFHPPFNNGSWIGEMRK